MRMNCLAQENSILMPWFEPSTSVSRNRHSNHIVQYAATCITTVMCIWPPSASGGIIGFKTVVSVYAQFFMHVHICVICVDGFDICEYLTCVGLVLQATNVVVGVHLVGKKCCG